MDGHRASPIDPRETLEPRTQRGRRRQLAAAVGVALGLVFLLAPAATSSTVAEQSPPTTHCNNPNVWVKVKTVYDPGKQKYVTTYRRCVPGYPHAEMTVEHDSPEAPDCMPTC